MTRAGRLAKTLEAATDLAAAPDRERLAEVFLERLRATLGPTDDIVVVELDGADGYTVLDGTTQGVAGQRGMLQSHPVLRAITALDEESVLCPGDAGCPRDLRDQLEAAGVREARWLPAPGSGRVSGGAILLSRNKKPKPPREAAAILVRHLGLALDRLAAQDQLHLARAAVEEFERTAAAMSAAVRDINSASSPPEVVGRVLGALTTIDPDLVGAVVGRVADGIVSNVAALGAMPRPDVDALAGTRLDGAPIGQLIMSQPQPYVGGAETVSLATRTRLMEPMGARSVLAAGGRAGQDVMIVVSGYRGPADPPEFHLLAAVETVLNTAALRLLVLDRQELLAAHEQLASRATVVFDERCSLRSAHPDAVELLGDALEVGTAPSLVYDTLDGDPVRADDLPWARAVRHRESVRSVSIRYRPTGRVHRVDAVPLESGGAVVSFEDVTASTPSQRVLPIRPPVDGTG